MSFRGHLCVHSLVKRAQSKAQIAGDALSIYGKSCRIASVRLVPGTLASASSSSSCVLV